MKRITLLRILILAVLLSLLLISGNAFAADKLKVVTTISDLASITKEVGGDKVDAQSIARGYQDPHFVEAKPSFLLLLKDADLLEVVGLELEIGWLPPLLDQSRNNNIRPGQAGYLDVSRGVQVLDHPSGTVNRSMGDVHPEGNPHYWLDLANAVRIARQIDAKLSEMRPADAPYFHEHLQAFIVKLNDANKTWMAELAPYQGGKII